MRRTFLIALSLAGGLLAFQAGFDMALIQKWSNAKVIRYQVTGVHDGRTSVVFGDREGKADVTDRVTLDFVWDKTAGKFAGDIKIADSKSEVKNIKADGTNCPPPALQGEYEHFQLMKHSASGEQIQLEGTRTFPAASVSQYPASCSMTPVPGGKESKILFVAIVDPSILALPPQANPNISVSADKKSFSIKGDGNWVWTYTPTVVQ
jgi:hypothetical protein